MRPLSGRVAVKVSDAARRRKTRYKARHPLVPMATRMEAGYVSATALDGSSMTITFVRADAIRHRALLIAMNVKYFEWMDRQISRDFGIRVTDPLDGSIPDYVASTVDKLCAAEAPEGVFYVVHRDGRPAGMGGVRQLADGASEMKRVFVPPEARGGGLGAAIVKRLIADARGFGYTTMRLESGPFMGSAHRLYEAEGFRDRAPYDGAEVPEELRHNWRFMERALGGV